MGVRRVKLNESRTEKVSCSFHVSLNKSFQSPTTLQYYHPPAGQLRPGRFDTQLVSTFASVARQEPDRPGRWTTSGSCSG